MCLARLRSVGSQVSAPRPQARSRHSWVFCPYDTHQRGESGYPGGSAPGTFRPQGLSTLSTAYSSPRPAAARRPQRRPWGSPFRVLLLPASVTPLGASPLLSFPGMTEAMPARLQRFFPAREGERAPARRRPHKPYPPGCSPLQGFRLRHRGRGFPRRAPRVAGPRELPTVPLPDAASGDC